MISDARNKDTVASRNSFNMVKIVHDKILDLCGLAHVPCVVVGAKSDLAKRQREVPEEEGQALATQYGCAWVEASAREDVNVSKVFELAVAEIERQSIRNQHTAPEGNNCCIM